MADTHGPSDGQDARSRRQDALHSLAREALGPTEAPEAPKTSSQADFSPLLPSSRGKRGRLIALSALIVVALVAAGVYGYQRLSVKPAETIPQTLRINLAASKLYCPEDFAWSPNSLSLAVIAETQDCATGQQGQGEQAMAIFDARSGALEKQAPITSPLATANLTGQVISIAWSRDSLAVYVTIATHDTSGQSNGLALLRVPVTNAHAQLEVDTAARYSFYGMIWHLSGKPSATALGQPVTPALTYTWQSGAIEPGKPFSPGLAAYSGVAVQAPGFSFWSAGTITPVLDPKEPFSPTKPPFALIYDSLLSQASPDGRYMASGLSLGARLQVPAGVGSPYNRALCITLQTESSCLAPVIPYADKALQAVAASVEAQAAQPDDVLNWNSASVAWRPDGQFLAALLPADGFDAVGSAARVTVYSATSGIVVAHFVAPRAFSNVGFSELGFAPVRWSPSGQQLALVDNGSSAITIWDVRGLTA
jgi:hypothetical protein